MARPKGDLLDDKEIIRLYNDGLSTSKIGQIFGVHKNTILNRLKKNNIDTSRKNRNYKFSNYNFNEYWLDEIDSQEKAYFLGFFYADGNVQTLDHKKNYLIRIKLQESDDYILQKFMELFESNKPLIYKEEQSPDTGKYYKKCEFALGNKHLWEQLQKLGCSCNKTYNCTFPEFIDDNFINSFVRGLFDGDGSIHIISRNSQRIYCEIYFVGTYNELLGLQQCIEYFTDCKGNLKQYDKKTKFLWNLNYGKQEEVFKILNWIYKDSSIHLDRKYEKYIQFINNR